MASVTPMGQNPDPTYRIAKHHVGTRLISARCLPLLNTAPSWYTRWKFFFLESAIPVNRYFVNNLQLYSCTAVVSKLVIKVQDG